MVAPPHPGSSAAKPAAGDDEADGPNPTHGGFAIRAPPVAGALARLDILDVTGRQVASVRGPSGSRLVWDGNDHGGRPAPCGIYLYRLEVGKQRTEGQVVVLR